MQPEEHASGLARSSDPGLCPSGAPGRHSACGPHARPSATPSVQASGLEVRPKTPRGRGAGDSIRIKAPESVHGRLHSRILATQSRVESAVPRLRGVFGRASRRGAFTDAATKVLTSALEGAEPGPELSDPALGSVSGSRRSGKSKPGLVHAQGAPCHKAQIRYSSPGIFQWIDRTRDAGVDPLEFATPSKMTLLGLRSRWTTSCSR